MAEQGRGAVPGTPAGAAADLPPVGPGALVHGLVLFALWVVLSGMLDGFHLGVGVVAAGAVALASRPLMLVRTGRNPGERIHLALLPWHRLLLYTFWLLREVAVANWQVLRIVLDPRLPIRPGIVRFRSRLRSDLGITTLANSITLTPGTITVMVEGDEFVVHALVAGEPVIAGIGEMQRRIAEALPPVEPAAGEE